MTDLHLKDGGVGKLETRTTGYQLTVVYLKVRMENCQKISRDTVP
jgi:hypothetical protein